ncbi:hypothetical protein [Polymorphospora lycopeni]|uniref:Uncharacterized protein n=1 Tax=Polymorphospora lycopeni TaxID=3140240 RepID=A0ABV5CKP6_9ACTN
MSNDSTADAYTTDDDGLTIRDDRGASLVVERFDRHRMGAWIARPGESDGHTVWLSPDDRRRLAAYLLDGAA